MNLKEIGLKEVAEGVYAKVVKKGACTAEFNKIYREVGKSFTYFGISAGDDEKINGYADLIEGIKVDWENENLIIVKI